MARAIVYGLPAGYAGAKEAEDRIIPGVEAGEERRARRPKARVELQSDAALPDGYLDRMAKYVPAEVLAFFLPLVTFIGKDDTWLWVVLGVGAVGTVLYLLMASVKQSEFPLPHFFVLSLAAFFVWAFGASGVIRDLIDVNEKGATVVLGCFVFLVPAVDYLLAWVWTRFVLHRK